MVLTKNPKRKDLLFPYKMGRRGSDWKARAADRENWLYY